MNQTLFKSKHLRCDIDLKGRDSNGEVMGMHHEFGSLGNDYEKTIFIGNLPWVLNEEDLRKHFASLGEIMNVRIIRDARTFIGKGFGYIMFANKDDMKKAILERNGQMFKGRELRVKKAVEAKRLEKKQQKKRDKKFDRKNQDRSVGHEIEYKKRDSKQGQEEREAEADMELDELRALQKKIEKFSGKKDSDDEVDVVKKAYKPFIDSTKKHLATDFDLELPNNMKVNKKKKEKILREIMSRQ